MAFLENNGDVILDGCLTDEGRRRLARGDSSFSIVKFALGDDEINYELFDTSATTALEDLSILQTPVLEAFTNNTSLMKSKLISLSNSRSPVSTSLKAKHNFARRTISVLCWKFCCLCRQRYI